MIRKTDSLPFFVFVFLLAYAVMSSMHSAGKSLGPLVEEKGDEEGKDDDDAAAAAHHHGALHATTAATEEDGEETSQAAAEGEVHHEEAEEDDVIKALKLPPAASSYLIGGFGHNAPRMKDWGLDSGKSECGDVDLCCLSCTMMCASCSLAYMYLCM